MDNQRFEGAKSFAMSAVTAAMGPLTAAQRSKFAESNAHLAARGMATSGYAVRQAINFHAEFAMELLRARFDALVEGCSLNGLEIDDEVGAAILTEIDLARSYLVAGARTSIAANLLPPQRNMVAPEALASMITEHIESTTGNLMAQFRLDIQRAILQSKLPQAQQKPSVTNIYHLIGHGSRVNIDSTDNSRNITTLSADQVFSQLNEELSVGVPQEDRRKEILQSLAQLQNAQNAPDFAHRYIEFVSVVADHLTLITPFIPALTELLKKAIS